MGCSPWLVKILVSFKILVQQCKFVVYLYMLSSTFQIVVENENRWPQDPPTVRCLTDIYHPNIDNFDEGEYSNVCVNALDLCNWDSQFDFETCIQSLLFLFYEPNFDDVLSLICCSDENFQELVQTSLKGGIVDGIPFKPNEGWLKKKGGGNSSQEKENEIDT